MNEQQKDQLQHAMRVVVGTVIAVAYAIGQALYTLSLTIIAKTQKLGQHQVQSVKQIERKMLEKDRWAA